MFALVLHSEEKLRPDSVQNALPPTADYVDKAIEMPSDADVDPKAVLEIVLHSA